MLIAVALMAIALRHPGFDFMVLGGAESGKTLSPTENMKRKPWPPTYRKLDALIADALVDAYGDSEQRTALYTAMEKHLVLPFETKVLGVDVTVERIDLTVDEQLVAICRRGRSRQVISILDLPIPTPPPPGAEWIAAYRRWVRPR